MPSYQANENLSFDALGYIFSYCAKDETILHPLETLLLVCKAWRDAALGHLTLWNNLRIYIGHQVTSRIWSARLPLRSARCGPEVPLDIDLRYFLETEHWDDDLPPLSHWDVLQCNPDPNGRYHRCQCEFPARAFLTRALETITGLNGSQCARWRSLTLDLGSYWCPHLEVALSLPTPILQKLVLKNVSIRVAQQLFPNATRVKKLLLFQSFLPSLPNCEEALVEATLEWALPDWGNQNLSLFGRAAQLQYLCLRSSIFGVDVPLPARLDHIRVLKIEGEYTPLPPALRTCQMPMLSWLVLNVLDGNQIDGILECVGLPMATLSRLTLSMDTERLAEVRIGSLTLELVSTLLSRVKRLESLEGNTVILSMVLRIMWQSVTTGSVESDLSVVAAVTANLKRISLTRMETDDTVKLDGTETALFFEEMAERWCCVSPNLLPDEFIACLIVI